MFYINSHIGTTIPTLYETVEALKQLDMFMFLELKSGSPLVRHLTYHEMIMTTVTVTILLITLFVVDRTYSIETVQRRSISL